MTAPTITNEQIEAIYKSTFEGMPGCVRSAPKPNETVFAFARALLATVPEVGPAIAGQCRNDGRCQYAIDHGAEGLAACPVGKCCMPIAPAIPLPAAPVQGWVSVKDRLPEKQIGVLITDGKSIASAEFIEVDNGYVYWTGFGFGGYEWEFDFRSESVTHWMQLPTLPPPPVGENE